MNLEEVLAAAELILGGTEEIGEMQEEEDGGQGKVRGRRVAGGRGKRKRSRRQAKKKVKRRKGSSHTETEGTYMYMYVITCTLFTCTYVYLLSPFSLPSLLPLLFFSPLFYLFFSPPDDEAYDSSNDDKEPTEDSSGTDVDSSLADSGYSGPSPLSHESRYSVYYYSCTAS